MKVDVAGDLILSFGTPEPATEEEEEEEEELASGVDHLQVVSG